MIYTIISEKLDWPWYTNENLWAILLLKIATKKWIVINITQDSDVLTEVPLLVFGVCNCQSSDPTTQLWSNFQRVEGGYDKCSTKPFQWICTGFDFVQKWFKIIVLRSQELPDQCNPKHSRIQQLSYKYWYCMDIIIKFNPINVLYLITKLIIHVLYLMSKVNQILTFRIPHWRWNESQARKLIL